MRYDQHRVARRLERHVEHDAVQPRPLLPDDVLAPNEALCPVCKIVVRSARELRDGDKVYCMACMTRLRVVLNEAGVLEARALY